MTTTPAVLGYSKVPYGTVVGSVLKHTVDLWYDPRRLPDSPGMVAMVEKPTRRVIFVTEFGEGLVGLPAEVYGLLDSEQAYSLATVFPSFRGPLRERVTESNHALWWADRWPGDRHLMLQLVTESRHALWWADRWPEDVAAGNTGSPEDISISG